MLDKVVAEWDPQKREEIKEMAETEEAVTTAISAQESTVQLIQTGSPQKEDLEQLLSIETDSIDLTKPD